MSGRSKNPTIRERLTCIETKQDALKEDVGEVKIGFNNHLEHHFWINVTLLGAIVAEAIGFIIVVVKMVN